VTAKSTEAVDDYLKAILELSGPSAERITSNALAVHLDVRGASVTGMLQKLAEQRPSLVKYEKHYGVRLSELGRRRALEIQRHQCTTKPSGWSITFRNGWRTGSQPN
jgi:Mn-dependent DtxR family transcriptional regulator